MPTSTDQLAPSSRKLRAARCRGRAISAYLGSRDTFDRAVADFAAGYGDQNERDFEAVTAAVESGKLSGPAEPGAP